ncbi:pseudouridine synthase [Bariatricus massiliensis]|uniref:Pseudouridine synthase n=1 Tax=Bariatricus massiliensis TaxID=1745713 RepID=A0ABS8DCK6_9FIRM|nr:pseudouridine synthase [Bariatricus massiliensis]MCB7303306.1 rRNA pseudouridine synthase [Bariatricus massiliensis]MCB7373438.1 rRNA pseudouridine synthase [Bariatricus massiliensis]MCB7386108.1 rRNA pseudouridine synthase [Bariatricus massiliensis]MCB7410270.1 rRNA pseudouridine synthase [Bariatricus massiliensis]
MIRLDKYLADMGVGTRSEVKNFIRRGMVTVDGAAASRPEQKIQPERQTVMVNGSQVCYVEFEYYMLNKPAGVVSAVTDTREKTVLDLLTGKKRKDLFPVGRLDKDTEGLLLITNDGELSHRLLSPSKHVDKTYFARIQGRATADDIRAFSEGIDIGDEKPALPAVLKILKTGDTSEVEITIQEGRFHQVKRMFEAVGKKVIYLKRLSMGSVVLDETLPPGGYRELTKEELERLC